MAELEVSRVLASLHSLRGYSREDLVKGDVSTLLFRYSKTRRACRIFLEYLKKNRWQVTPKALSQFTRDLHEGRVEAGFSYRRESFYRNILRRLLVFGFIEKQTHYPRKIIYAPVIQPIPKRTPLLKTWWGLAYLVAEKWNREFEK
ncbi:MAG: hypothetical protein QG670_1932 [Thermoproteota archaeon]|nr:hypothetical protein [Thermoproteota archaeon]